MEELRPCPFCGSKVRIDHNKFLKIHAILCDKCSATVSFIYTKSRNETIDLWNKRVKPLSPQE